MCNTWMQQLTGDNEGENATGMCGFFWGGGQGEVLSNKVQSMSSYMAHHDPMFLLIEERNQFLVNNTFCFMGRCDLKCAHT